MRSVDRELYVHQPEPDAMNNFSANPGRSQLFGGGCLSVSRQISLSPSMSVRSEALDLLVFEFLPSAFGYLEPPPRLEGISQLPKCPKSSTDRYRRMQPKMQPSQVWDFVRAFAGHPPCQMKYWAGMYHHPSGILT
jgi:hypothetical protein